MKFKSTVFEQLLQFRDGPIFDGDLISKTARDSLVKSGLVFRVEGYQSLTEKGLQYLVDLGLAK